LDDRCPLIALRGVRVKLLCLSNGHGEDAIAVRILSQLQQQSSPPEIVALPLVGDGLAYQKLETVSMIGPVKRMPSGGFIYMDGQQLWGDLQHGLLQLTWEQIQVIRAWARSENSAPEKKVILAVGDIVPLLFAWLSGANYGFVGTAKSEYYLRDEAGLLPRQSWFERLESWSGSVYLPWERALMSHKKCQAVFPRDSLTAATLQKFSIPAFDLGNPMMDDLADDLAVENSPARFYDHNYARNAELTETQRPLVVVLLPGSRSPEAYDNWEIIIAGVADLLASYGDRPVELLAAIAPGLDLPPLQRILQTYGWRTETMPPPASATWADIQDPNPLHFRQNNTSLILTQQRFVNCLQNADVAIAMAGTATEQFVGLGKPAIAIPGRGPQFTAAFAEAQSRLLGSSLILVKRPSQVGAAVQQLFRDPDRLDLIAKNGQRRMGNPGAAHRIADCLMERFTENRS
jgi:uncharacterized protein (TIGR03492 family)